MRFLLNTSKVAQEVSDYQKDFENVIICVNTTSNQMNTWQVSNREMIICVLLLKSKHAGT